MPASGPLMRCDAVHLEAIRQIYNDCILTTTALYEYQPRSSEVMEAWWAAKQAAGLPVLGIEAAGGALAGFATWGPFRHFPAYKYSAEHSVYVAADCRGQGIGRRLLAAIIEDAQTRDLHLLVGAIDASNAASIALHRNAGFVLSGRLPEAGFKFGRWLDLEFWHRRLTGPATPVDG